MLAVDSSLRGISESENDRSNPAYDQKPEAIPETISKQQQGQLRKFSVSGDVQYLPKAPPDTIIYTQFPGDYSAGVAPILKASGVAGGNLELKGDLPVPGAHNVYPWITDGQSWFPVVGHLPTDSSGTVMLPCPITIVGDCTNALQILSASGYENLRVDTVNSDIYIGASGQVLIATSKPLGGPELLYGLYYNKQGAFVIGPNTPLFHATPGTEQIIFGGNSTTEVQTNVFANSVKFKSIAYDVVTTATDLTLSATASNLYIGILTRPDVTITIDLPEIVSVLGGTGAKEGQLLIFKDEAALATSNSGGQFVVVLNPFGTQGINVSGVVLGSYNMVSHDITLIARGTDWVLS